MNTKARLFITCVILITLVGIASPQDSLNVSLVGMIYSNWLCLQSVFSVGDLLYVADQETGLYIIDVSDSSNPTILSHCMVNDPGGISRFVYVEGDYAYLTVENSGLAIFDISDSLSPVEIGFASFPRNIYHIVVAEGYAYVSLYPHAVIVFDVTDPTDPFLLSECNLPAFPDGLAISDNYLYVACYSHFCIVDVTLPLRPSLICFMAIEEPRDVAVSGNYAYIASGEQGFMIINISNHYIPYLVSQLSGMEDAVGVTQFGNYAYIANHGTIGFWVIDVSNPLNPQVASSFSALSNLWDVAVEGNSVYTYTNPPVAHIIDVSVPNNPIISSSFNNNGKVYDVEKIGDYAFVADGPDGLRIVDVSIPTNPIEVAHWGDIATYIKAVEISGNYAYLMGNGIWVLDISDTLNPILVGGDPFDEGMDLALGGDYMYIASGDDGLYIFDVSDPTRPTFAGRYYNEDLCSNDLDVLDNHAYLSNEMDGLVILDISSPDSVFYVGRFQCLYIRDVVVEGNYAYIGYDDGLQILDISNPHRPNLIGAYPNIYGFPVVQVAEGHAYAVTWDNNFQVLDVSDPTHPVLNGYHTSYGYPYNIYVEGDYAYLADDYYLEIFDCSQTYASQRKTNSFSYDEVSPADVFTLKSISPNPFNSTTTISFNLTQQLATKLTVFNQIGQEIAVLSEGILNAGEHKVAWNAEDYATGLYFVEISTPVGKELRKIILMK